MQTSDELVIAGTGHIWLGPRAATLPDRRDPTEELAAAYRELGYTSTDGVALAHAMEITDVMAWQKGQPIRRNVRNRNLTVRCGLLQFNRDTIPLAFGGGSWAETTTGVWSFTPPRQGAALLDYVLVVDLVDGEKHYRIVVERGNIAEDAEITFNAERESEIPLAFRMLAPEGDSPGWYIVTDDPAAGEAS